jgi:hypothetical protein
MTLHDQSASLHDTLQQFLTAADAAGADSPAVAEARSAVAALLARIDELDTTAAGLTAQIVALRDAEHQLTRAEQLVGTERELRLEVERLNARNDELLTLLDRIYRSASWKVTEPMRKAVGVARTTAVDAVRQFRGR